MAHVGVVYGNPPLWGELYLPPGRGPHGVVVLVHGGYWRVPYGPDQLTALAYDVAGRGLAAWVVGYHRVGEPGGGWPGTFADVGRAVDLLAPLAASHRLDLGRVMVVGHSAGGHLALWLAARPGLPLGGPGANPLVTVRAAVALAGVLDLDAADAEGLSNGAAAELLGGSAADVRDRYAYASPLRRVPLGVPTLLVHGLADAYVPVAQSRAYAAAAEAAGDDIELVELPGVGHFELIDPAHAAWRLVAERLVSLAPEAVPD